MSSRKKIPQKIRRSVYEKCNHRCAYCGCKLEYKDMQVDHIESVYKNTDIRKVLSEDEINSEENLLPACRACNFYKSTFNLEEFRGNLSTKLYENLRKNYNYKLLVKYDLIEEKIKPVKFYFERMGNDDK